MNQQDRVDDSPIVDHRLPGSDSAAGLPKPHRFEALDALRGICACMVVLLHFETSGVVSASQLVRHSYLFVDFFFVLSGFVIAASYGEKLRSGFSIRKFMLLRLGRVYPLHAAILLIFFGYEVLLDALKHDLFGAQWSTGFFSLSSWIASMALSQIFVGPNSLYWNGPSWSIAAEIWTYLIFASLFKASPPVFRLLAAGTAMLCLLYIGLSPGLPQEYRDLIHDGALARCILGFSLGALAQQLFYRDRRLEQSARWTAIELAALAAAATFIIVLGGNSLELAVPFLFAAVVLLFSCEAGAVSRILKTKPFLLLGSISYSIYMVHWFLYYRALSVLRKAQHWPSMRWLSLQDIGGGKVAIVAPGVIGDLLSFAFLAIVIGCAWITFNLIEKPARDWSRRKVLGSRKSAAARTEATAPTF